jgi:hypothetical protein
MHGIVLRIEDCKVRVSGLLCVPSRGHNMSSYFARAEF